MYTVIKQVIFCHLICRLAALRSTTASTYPLLPALELVRLFTAYLLGRHLQAKFLKDQILLSIFK